jgi:hypothetical protein
MVHDLRVTVYRTCGMIELSTLRFASYPGAPGGNEDRWGANSRLVAGMNPVAPAVSVWGTPGLSARGEGSR